MTEDIRIPTESFNAMSGASGKTTVLPVNTVKPEPNDAVTDERTECSLGQEKRY